eukprot:scaffold413645_cov19-Prasinocladus_malaysianus.AAC.1
MPACRCSQCRLTQAYIFSSVEDEEVAAQRSSVVMSQCHLFACEQAMRRLHVKWLRGSSFRQNYHC